MLCTMNLSVRTSMDSVTGPPSNISGAMYCGVPAVAFLVLMKVLWACWNRTRLDHTGTRVVTPTPSGFAFLLQSLRRHVRKQQRRQQRPLHCAWRCLMRRRVHLSLKRAMPKSHTFARPSVSSSTAPAAESCLKLQAHIYAHGNSDNW